MSRMAGGFGRVNSPAGRPSRRLSRSFTMDPEEPSPRYCGDRNLRVDRAFDHQRNGAMQLRADLLLLMALMLCRA
ncbi:hypothetical protein VSR34_22290 [Paraburkholderia sp. JHI2823]|uniref:hypothetical protein n=1 Tax=Paraburkholderia sp. JHI2823 TaxID=3112960 RepID=UPI0031722D67